MVPLYQQIIDDLKESILSQKIKVGEKLPTEKELSDSYSVSRITAKRALSDLEQIGMVTRTRGKGSFVKSNFEEPLLQTTRTISFILPFSDMTFGDFTQSLMPYLKERGMTLFITDPDYLRETAPTVIMQNFDGLIYYPMDTDQYLDTLFELSVQNFPVVLLDKELYGLQLPYVSSDNFSGGAYATQSLIDKGHKKIAFITNNHSHHPQTTRNRYLGYISALKENQIAFHTSFNSQTATQACAFQLIREESVTALVCENDLIALELMRELQTAGLDIPKDVSIIGFDNIQATGLSRPPLTTIAQNFKEMGEKAGELLMRWIRTGSVPKSAQVPIQLIERQSTKDINAD